MKREVETTKSINEKIDLMTMSDEEFGLELLEFSEDMLRKGIRLAIANRQDIDTIIVPKNNDNFFENVFNIIGEKYKMTAETVRKYVYILMKAMIECADEEMKRELRSTVRCGKSMPTLEEFIVYMYSVTHNNIY